MRLSMTERRKIMAHKLLIERAIVRSKRKGEVYVIGPKNTPLNVYISHKEKLIDSIMQPNRIVQANS